MENIQVRTVAVLGAGVMGAQIAAHFANAGFSVFLYDLAVDDKTPNKLAEDALKRLTKLKPAPLGDNQVINSIKPANYQTDIEKLKECDLIIEAIAERMDWKESLYMRIVGHINDHAILVSNTSGLSINKLANILPKELRARFCGVHFFNPPRYMPLVELIPDNKTKPEILDYLETFFTTKLGKHVVRAKDTPNFIANRIGVFSMLSVFYHMSRLGLSFDEVDALTGRLIGHAKSATFRTLDVVGLDTMSHVIQTMTKSLSEDPWHRYFIEPTWLKALITKGALGQKTGCGVYKKEGKAIMVLDLQTQSYRLADKTANDTVKQIFAIKDLGERLAALSKSDDKQAQFLWAIHCDLFHYSAYHASDIAVTVRDIDMAMRFGFGWAEGPFETWQKAGWQLISGLIDTSIINKVAMSDVDIPEWVLQCGNVYHQDTAYSPEANTYLERSDLPIYERQLYPVRLLEETARQGHTMFENAGVRLWTLGDSIAILSLNSKQNTFNDEVIEGVQDALHYAEHHAKAVVIWPDHGSNFSYGADLGFFGKGVKQNPDNASNFAGMFQDMCLAVRYCNIPVIAALRGMALGGGCELALHADCRVAAFETYIGLVEAGVGLLPAGGGSKEFAYKAFKHNPADPMRKMSEYFKQIAMAEVSSSALDAKLRGFLCEEDLVVMHSDEILYVALAKAKAMSEFGYEPPVPPTFKVMGEAGIANFKTQLINMREGNFISDYDYFIGVKIAEVLCGGDIDTMSTVDEQWMLAREREAFGELARQQKTLERVEHTLKTGKPLRN